MNILLATYSYYPYHYGGTEVYVAGLAGFLKNKGHSVTIIAGMPPKAFAEHPVFYEDEQLKTVRYEYEGIEVVGVILNDESTTEIYKKYRNAWSRSWRIVLDKLGKQKFDILHLHANTSPVGENLIEAVKSKSPQVKCVASYHLPISCAKGTLLFGNTLQACGIAPDINICTACTLASKLHWSLTLSKPLVKAMPLIGSEFFPTGFRLKYLLKEFIQSFQSLNSSINIWHVFSKQIQEILLLNKVNSNKVILLKHGVHPCFFVDGDASIHERSVGKEILFLYAGRFDKVKGFFTLLKAWDSLPEKPGRKLIIAGQNQIGEQAIENLLQQFSQRQDVEMVGTLSQQELAMLMKRVHCTIIPSEWIEIGPLVFHEAIAAGSDVIASDIGGCKELSEKYFKKSKSFNVGNSASLKKTIENFTYSSAKMQTTTQLDNYNAVELSYNHLLKTGVINTSI